MVSSSSKICIQLLFLLYDVTQLASDRVIVLSLRQVCKQAASYPRLVPRVSSTYPRVGFKSRADAAVSDHGPRRFRFKAKNSQVHGKADGGVVLRWRLRYELRSINYFHVYSKAFNGSISFVGLTKLIRSLYFGSSEEGETTVHFSPCKVGCVKNTNRST